MAKKLIIVRHGNTFLPEQTPTRVGRGTDLSLVEEQRGRAVGKYLLSKDIKLDKIYAAPLKRTMQTAELILDEMHSDLQIIPEEDFSEIYYGPDENKTEEKVKLRLGKDYALNNNLLIESDEELLSIGNRIIEQWDKDGKVPNGWSVNVNNIINIWHQFADSIAEGETVLLCSSNGVIRFAPSILSIPYEEFTKQHNIKVATGSVSIFDYKNGEWECSEWNTKANKLF